MLCFGVAQSYARAEDLYRKACDSGNSHGCHNLGAVYQQGHGVIQNDGAAANLYKQACDSGDQLSCIGLQMLLDSCDPKQ